MTEKRDVFRSCLVVQVFLTSIGVVERHRAVGTRTVAPGRIVAQFLVVEIEVGRVETKAVDPAVHPEFRHIEDLRLNLFVVEIEVRIFLPFF